jgi:hypothetical protein
MQGMQRIRLSCAVVLAAAAMSGCTDAGGSLIIVQNQIPGEGCIIPPAPAEFRGRGIIDVQATAGYLFTPVVKSLLVANPQSARVVAIQGADVDVTFASSLFSDDEEAALRDDRLTRFSQAVSGSVDPNGTASFGFLVLSTGLLDRIGDKLADGELTQVTVEVVMFGEMDGSDVESNPFSYPIDVCDGCMKIDNGDCANLSSEFEPQPGGECNLLQDVPVDCCTAGGAERCPASST